MNLKQKVRIEINRYFLESDFVGFHRLFVLVYSNQNTNLKGFQTQRFYLPKGIIDNCKVPLSMEKNVYGQAVHSDIKNMTELEN